MILISVTTTHAGVALLAVNVTPRGSQVVEVIYRDTTQSPRPTLLEGKWLTRSLEDSSRVGRLTRASQALICGVIGTRPC